MWMRWASRACLHNDCSAVQYVAVLQSTAVLCIITRIVNCSWRLTRTHIENDSFAKQAVMDSAMSQKKSATKEHVEEKNI